MRDLLLNVCAPSIWVIVMGEVLISVGLLSNAKTTKNPVSWLSFFLTLGLITDAALIGMGAILSPEILEAVSPIRFIAHGILIPLLFPICGYALKLKKKTMTVIWIVTAVIMTAGLAEALATDLEAKEIAGVIRYASTDATPAWARTISMVLSFGTVIPLMIAGLIVWIKQKNPCLFLSGFFMFAFSALGPATGNTDLIFCISMFGELLMVLFLFLFSRRFRKSIL